MTRVECFYWFGAGIAACAVGIVAIPPAIRLACEFIRFGGQIVGSVL